jgi:predicted regulator of Ras-like GTPase activity (Roadblock/LC7/MglB family)
MQEILDALNRVRGVGGCMVLSSEGLPMLSALRDGVDENTLATSLASVIDQGNKLTSRLDLGAAKGGKCLADKGGVLILATGPGYLAIVVDPSANFALLQLEARPFAERIAQRLKL